MTTSDFVKKRPLLFFAVTIGTGLIFLDMTILPVALPTIQKKYLLNDVVLQWILNAYTTINAAFILVGGKLGDRYGHRRLFCLGIALFAFASTLGGLAIGPITLIGARALQGFGAAMMGPAISALIMQSYPVQKRGRMVGMMVAIGSLFLAFGPVMGGFLTDAFSWRFIFWINIPFSVAAIWMAMAALNRSAKHPTAISLWGVLLFALMLISLITYLLEAQSWGFGKTRALCFLLAFTLFFILFWCSERRLKTPFFDSTLFRNRHYRASVVVIFCSQFFFLITVFWPIFYQKVLGFSATEAGLFITLSTIPILIFAPIGGFLLDRFGPRLPIAIGCSLILFTFIWFHYKQSSATIPMLLPGLFTFGVGTTFIFTPSATTASTVAGPKKRGVASGTFNSARNIGSAIAVALLGTLIDYFAEQGGAAHTREAVIFAYEKVDLFCAAVVLSVGIYSLITYRNYSKNQYN